MQKRLAPKTSLVAQILIQLLLLSADAVSALDSASNVSVGPREVVAVPASDRECTGVETSHDEAHDDNDDGASDDGESYVNWWTREWWTTQDKNENRTIFDLWFNMGCDVVFERERPIPTGEQFAKAIELYNGIVGDERAIYHHNKTDSFRVGVEVRQVPGKGRGIFAAEPIKKGERVRDGISAVFHNANDYRKFILTLETEFACDVLQWAYVQVNDEEEYEVAVELDAASMCNDGGESSGNMGCDDAHAAKYDWDCSQYEYALRDIEVGEEILCVYGDFDELDGWWELGLE